MRRTNIKLDSVRVEFAGFSIETDFDVTCENFESTFNKEDKKKSFHNSSDLLKFKLLTPELKRVGKRRACNVRGAIVYNYGNVTKRYCFDTWGYFYKDGKYFYNKELLIYLSNKLYANHPEYLDTLRQQ